MIGKRNKTSDEETVEINNRLYTKSDVDKFINKFGKDMYDRFIKLQDDLEYENGESDDFAYYTKFYDLDELEDLLDWVEDKTSKTTSNNTNKKQIRGKYNFLGNNGGYLIYQPLDYLSFMDLEQENETEDIAKRDFDNNTNGYNGDKIRLYYFLNPRTLKKEYIVRWHSRRPYSGENPPVKLVDNNSNVVKVMTVYNYEIVDSNDEIVQSAAENEKIKNICSSIGIKLYNNEEKGNK